MRSGRVPFRRTAFVCVRTREGAVACANPGRGGDSICEELKRAVQQEGLASKVRVVRSGCLDQCAKGPNIFIYPEGEWRMGVALEDLPEVLKRLKEGL